MDRDYVVRSHLNRNSSKHIMLAVIAGVLILAAACGLIPDDQDTGIMGTVTLGPVNPVSRPGETDSVPYPDAEFIIRNLSTGKSLKVKSDKDGMFRVFVPEGSYVLESDPDGVKLPYLKPVGVEVVKGSFTEVSLGFDTGIR